MNEQALRIMREELGKEIRWLENHRSYFHTPGCADHAIERLGLKIEQITRRIQAQGSETTLVLTESWCEKCQKKHPALRCPDPQICVKPEVRTSFPWCKICRRHHPAGCYPCQPPKPIGRMCTCVKCVPEMGWHDNGQLD